MALQHLDSRPYSSLLAFSPSRPLLQLSCLYTPLALCLGIPVAVSTAVFQRSVRICKCSSDIFGKQQCLHCFQHLQHPGEEVFKGEEKVQHLRMRQFLHTVHAPMVIATQVTSSPAHQYSRGQRMRKSAACPTCGWSCPCQGKSGKEYLLCIFSLDLKIVWQLLHSEACGECVLCADKNALHCCRTARQCP